MPKRARKSKSRGEEEEESLPIIFTNKRLMDYSDSEDDDDQIRPPPRKKKRAMVIYSDSEEEEEDSFDSLYTIKAKSEIESRKFKTKSNVYSVDVKKFPDKTSPVEFIPRLFQQMADDIKRNCGAQGNDKLRIRINHPSLKLAIFISYMNASDLSGELITQEIKKVLQSNENFIINDGQLSLDITHTRVPEGSGRKSLHHGLYFESENMRTNKRSIVCIDNTEDVMCMARAIVVGKCYAEKEDSDSWKQKWNHIRKSYKSLQTVEAMKLLDQANIPYDKSCGLEEYKLIQAVMAPDYLIKVHSQHPKDGLLFPFQFKKQRETKVIYIYWNGDHHYDTITKVTGFLGCNYYSEYCDFGYNHRGNHRCPDVCDGCYNNILCTYERKIFCRDCKRTFRSTTCFNNHKRIKTN